MIKVIHQTSLKLITFLLFSVSFLSCNSNSAVTLENYKQATITLPDSTSFQAYIADTPLRQSRGLSDIKDKDFSENLGMFFPGTSPQMRQFWMPNTFFDLDIFYLSQDYYILEIERSLKHHIGYTPKSEVPMSKEVKCTHVLELKSSSPLAKKLKEGMILKLKMN